MTPDQFTTSFGPTVQDYQTVSNFAVANALTIVGSTPTRQLLTVQGKVSDIERAFNIHLLTYQHPTEARQFFAADVDPTVSRAVPVLDVMGLSDYPEVHPVLRLVPDGVVPANQGGSGPYGNLIGADFRNAYAPNATQTGAGQIVGLLEFDGYYAADITSYETLAGLPSVPLQNILLNSFSGSPGSGNDEVALDIDMAVAMAPGLSKIVVFETTNTPTTNVLQAFVGVLEVMAQSNQISQFTSSWSVGGVSSSPSGDSKLQQLATQGQSFFQASGDLDAYVSSDSDYWPQFSPYLTAVGATTLTMTNSGATYLSETVWNYLNEGIPYAYGSGGGISTNYGLPWWQSGLGNSTNQGSASHRMIPDVAMAGDWIWIYAFNGESTNVSGTSAGAPLWAGYTALANQWALTNGLPTAGFINPAVYQLGDGQTSQFSYNSCFHDTTNGNNEWSGSPTKFSAVSGYDLCTGWGTPRTNDLMRFLTISIANRFLTTLGSFGGTPGAYPMGGLVLPGYNVFGTTFGGSIDYGSVFTIGTNGTGYSTLHSFSGATDGGYPTCDLVAQGNARYGTATVGGSHGVGTVFAVASDGSWFSTLHSFAGTDGSYPYAGLAVSGATLYGTASYGGSSGDGTLFSLGTNGASFSTLHTFSGNDGTEPYASLIVSSSTLFGTALAGGPYGAGTVFSIGTSGAAFTTLHSFSGSDGAEPRGRLVLSGSKLYGTTYEGGSYGYGMVFSLNTDGSGFTSLYSFGTFAPYDGEYPETGVVLSGGVLYGTTYSGGFLNAGTVYRVNTDSSNFACLYCFSGNADGGNPAGGLAASANDLYGTTEFGGTNGGYGTIFVLPMR